MDFRKLCVACVAFIACAFACVASGCSSRSLVSNPGVATPAGGGQQDEPLSDDSASDTVYLYPFQKEVEARLNGTAEENHRYALLLPLHVGLRVYEPTYKMEILATIGRLNLTEALPLLEEGLKWDAGYWEGARLGAAHLWIRFRTEGMNEVERARFLASTFRPGFPFRVHTVVRYALDEMGEIGRREMVDALLSLKTAHLGSLQDVLIASSAGALFTTSDFIRLDVHEADKLAAAQGSFVQVVALKWYVIHGHSNAVRLAEKLAGGETIRSANIRSGILHGVAYCPGGDRVFTRVLRDMRQEPATVAKEHELSMILGGVSHAVGGPFSPPPADLVDEIKYIAVRDIPEPAEPWGDELSLYAARLRSRNWALSILSRLGMTVE